MRAPPISVLQGSPGYGRREEGSLEFSEEQSIWAPTGVAKKKTETMIKETKTKEKEKIFLINIIINYKL
jgi:hypothetical protein